MKRKPFTIKYVLMIAATVVLVVGGCIAYWMHQEDLKAAAVAHEAEVVRLAAERLQLVTVKAKQPVKELTKPTPPPPEPRPIVVEWQEFNPDVIAYLKIDGTKVDYPVLQGTDNDYYLNYTIDHIKATRGSIFMDCNVLFDPLDLPRHLLIHGHHMRDGTMFHNISLYKDEKFFNDHPLIHFETLYLDTVWQVFSVYVVDSNEYVPMSFRTDEAYQNYLDKILARSLHNAGIEVGIDDTIMTLNTCSYEFSGAHTLIAAKLVETHWTYEKTAIE